jgi:hypothetical protein
MVITSVMLFLQYYNGMGVNYSSEKVYNIGPWCCPPGDHNKSELQLAPLNNLFWSGGLYYKRFRIVIYDRNDSIIIEPVLQNYDSRLQS